MVSDVQQHLHDNLRFEAANHSPRPMGCAGYVPAGLPQPSAERSWILDGSDLMRFRDHPQCMADLHRAILDPDGDTASRAIVDLQWRGEPEVLELAIMLVGDQDPIRRSRGVEILGQIGMPAHRFSDQSWNVLSTLVRLDPSERVQVACVHALAQLRDPRAVPLLLEMVALPGVDLRRALAVALGRFAADHLDVVPALMALMTDPDDDVRDWATLGLGTLSCEDGPEIRAALLARIDDHHADTRQEALLGLARRGDRRAIRPLIAELQGGLSIALQEAMDHLLGESERGRMVASLDERIRRLVCLINAPAATTGGSSPI
jgi:hypothetical protein